MANCADLLLAICEGFGVHDSLDLVQEVLEGYRAVHGLIICRTFRSHRLFHEEEQFGVTHHAVREKDTA